MIAGKRCYSISEAMAFGPGAFIWEKGAHPRLLILLPLTTKPGGYEGTRLNVRNWGFPDGDHEMINDDFERPCIKGSIGGHPWHGWLWDGCLVTEQPIALRK